MFDIGWSELLIVAIVSIIILGPQDFLLMMRKVGQYVGAAKRIVGELHGHIDDVGKKVEIDEFKEIRTDFETVRDTVNSSMNDVLNTPDNSQQKLSDPHILSSKKITKKKSKTTKPQKTKKTKVSYKESSSSFDSKKNKKL